MKYRKHSLFFVFFIGLICFMGCDTIDQFTNISDNEHVVATVNKVSLSSVVLSKGMSKYDNPKDSAMIAEAFVEHWIVNQLMFDKAKTNKSDDKQIKALVEKYKKALYIHNYEASILNTAVEKEITDVEIKSFYDTFKSQDPLAEPVYKLKILIFEDGIEKLRKFEKGWKNNETIIIDEYKALATYFQLDTSIWYKKSDIRNLLPKGFPEERLNSTGFQKSKSDDKISYLRIYHKTDRGEHPPLTYIKEKIRKILMHQRQKETLERYKEDLYNEAIRNKRIKIYKSTN